MQVNYKRKYSKEKLSLRRALLWIFGSTICVGSMALASMLYYFHVKSLYGTNEAYNIVAIVQSAGSSNSLQTVYLSELLDLSVDDPVNLYNFNSQDAQKKLNNSPVIKHATIKKVKPGMLYIDYVMREPFAHISDYNNTLIDREGVIFPFHPFYTPKKIPEFYLGLNKEYEGINPLYDWGKKIEDKKFDLALDLYDQISNLNFFKLTRLDVSQAFEPSYGQRQIILMGETAKHKDVDGVTYNFIFHWIIRLNSDLYDESFEQSVKIISAIENQHLKTHDYSKGSSTINFGTKILDMRIPQLGFIRNYS